MTANTQTTEVEKQKISIYEFEKKVQIEMEHLIYFDRLKRNEAEAEAKKYVSSKYVVG